MLARDTLSNHDYSILSPTAAAAQIAYTSADPTGRWTIPDHNYAKTFTSASGFVSIQVVQTDSTPLHDRYLYSGASGGGFSTDQSGADTIPNNNAGASQRMRRPAAVLGLDACAAQSTRC